MEDHEIVDRYVRKGTSISTLADLNACKPAEIKKVLKTNGVNLPAERTKSKEVQAIEKTHVMETVQHINKGEIAKEEIQHMPISVREALSKEEIYLTEMIDDYTNRIREIQEFRKRFL